LTLAPEEGVSKPPLSQVKLAQFQTPLNRKVGNVTFDNAPFGSAMKGVVLTNTGELLETPSSNGFAKLFVATPKVGLNFEKIFEYEEEQTEKPVEDPETEIT
jgi:NIMA (never in mitosis gene a)-related kinase